MYRRLLIIFSIILATAGAAGAETASQLLDRAAKNFRSAASITAKFTLTSPNGTASGSLTFAGDKFVMTSAQMQTWYDGTTQWTYIPADKEVSVSEPTPEELQQINPFIVINSFRTGYTAVESKAVGGKRCLRLTAKSKKAEIQSAIIYLDAKTLLPSSITLTMSNRQSISIALTGVAKGKKLPLSTFRFQKAKFPGVYVNDLR